MKKYIIYFILSVTSLVAYADFSFGTDTLKINFADTENGAGIKFVENVVKSCRFWKNESAKPFIWRLGFYDLQDNGSKRIFFVDNTAPAKCSFKQTDKKLTIIWDAIILGGNANALCVEMNIDKTKDKSLSMNLHVRIKNMRYGLAHQDFPYVAKAIIPAAESLLFPRGNVGSRMVDYPLAGQYPSCESQVQFLGWFRKNTKSGIYMGVHDPYASHKLFHLTENFDFYVRTYAMNSTVPGKSEIPFFPVVIAATESPWSAVGLYRNWALLQKWTQKGKMNARKDLPAKDATQDLWYKMSGAPDDVAARFEVEPKRKDINIAVHWYSWSIYRFDTHYPDYFPAKKNFAKAINSIQHNGNYVVPYINGRLWDCDQPDFVKEGKSGAILRIDGTMKKEDYNSGVSLAVMCPSSKNYGRKLRAVIDKLVCDYNVKGVYIDQIAAAAPAPCFDPKHGHPLGGGGWWQQAYREMLSPVVEKYGNRILIASENGAEPYIDSINNFLLWMAVFPDDFPSLPAVYNQYARYFCSPAEKEDNRNEFCTLMSRCLLWGVQPGWLGWLHGVRNNSAEAVWRKSYIDRIIDFRKKYSSVIVDGMLIDEVEFLSKTETMPVKFKRNGKFGGKTADGVQNVLAGNIWRSDDRQELAVVVAELSGKRRTVTFRIEPEKYGIDGKDKNIYLNKSGQTKKIIAVDGAFTVKEQIEPHEIQVYLLSSK